MASRHNGLIVSKQVLSQACDNRMDQPQVASLDLPMHACNQPATGVIMNQRNDIAQYYDLDIKTADVRNPITRSG